MALPKDLVGLRACLLCHLIKQADQFDKNGCENCEEYLGMKHNRDLVNTCTTSNYSGMIGLTQPSDSWVARWQRINKKEQGIYAISVSGKLPPNILNELRSLGVIDAKPPRE